MEILRAPGQVDLAKFAPDNLRAEAMYGLPQEVKFCSRCVMSNQRPRIIFDQDGICSGCRNSKYFKDNVDWMERDGELCELLEKHRRKDGYWDVIVPSSGGKDSAFVAHQLKYKYGMTPLTVTWTPLIYTDIGYQNFQSFRDAGFTNLMCSPALWGPSFLAACSLWEHSFCCFHSGAS